MKEFQRLELEEGRIVEPRVVRVGPEGPLTENRTLNLWVGLLWFHEHLFYETVELGWQGWESVVFLRGGWELSEAVLGQDKK